jgi:hypothetical protein
MSKHQIRDKTTAFLKKISPEPNPPLRAFEGDMQAYQNPFSKFPKVVFCQNYTLSKKQG